MLSRSIQGSVPTFLLSPVSAANTAAATSTWVAVPTNWAGDVAFIVSSGAITGSMASILQTADDGSGTGVRTVTFADATAAFTGISAADKQEVKVIDRAALGTHVKFVGTVTTGPILLGVVMLGVPRTA